MTPAEVDVAIAYYVGLFGRDVSDDFVPVWTAKLSDLEPAEVQAAIDRLAMGGFPPNVIQIRADVLTHRANAPAFGEAWAEMTEKASTCDWFGALPEFSHPAVKELARQVGWDSFRASDPGDSYLVHQASSRYSDIAQRAVEREFAGLPAYPEPAELPEGMAELVDGIGGAVSA